MSTFRTYSERRTTPYDVTASVHWNRRRKGPMLDARMSPTVIPAGLSPTGHDIIILRISQDTGDEMEGAWFDVHMSPEQAQMYGEALLQLAARRR